MCIPKPVVKWLQEFSCSHSVTLVSKRLLHQKNHWDCFGYQQIAAVLHVIIEGEAKKKMNIDIKKSDITKKMIYLYIFHVFHDRLFHKSVLVSAYFPVLLKKKRKCMYIYCSILPMLLLAIARTTSCDRWMFIMGTHLAYITLKQQWMREIRVKFSQASFALWLYCLAFNEHLIMCHVFLASEE